MTCQHPNVRSDASETGIRVWACDDCRVRFAPAPLDGLLDAVYEAALSVIENNYAPDPSLRYDVNRWGALVRAVNVVREGRPK